MSCIICNECSDPLIKVTDKGLTSLIDFSKKRNEDGIYQILVKSKSEKTLVLVDENCRKRFNDKRKLTTSTSQDTRDTRNSTSLFNWKVNCFFCNQQCIEDSKNPSRRNWHLASTLQMRQSVILACQSRLETDPKDEWALQVQKRTLDCIDFVAVEARYHATCRLRFQSQRLSTDEPKVKKKKGRNVNLKQMEAFEKACKWLEDEATIHSMPEFKKKVQEFSEDYEAYDSRYLKKLLKDFYGSHISFSEELGKETLIYFIDMANFIINKNFREKTQDIHTETERIIKTAATLIKTEIRDRAYDNEFYPTNKEIQSPWIPNYLRTFLSCFTKSSLKQESIGQVLTKSASPMQIPPLLFALAVEVDHLYGSKWLNEELYKLGFAVSYSEVKRFKQACVINQSIDQQIQRLSSDTSFTQFIADNVDHNIVTLDGKGSFHGMGIIASTVSSRDHIIEEIKIKRPQKLLKVDELTSKTSSVPINEYNFSGQRKFESIHFKTSKELLQPYVLSKALNTDLIWHAASLFSKPESPRPNWSGYMQKISHGDHLPSAAITLLPIIDLKPTDYTCIYSTLLFVINQCKKLNIITPSITFDQPLWLKATEISIEKSLDIVIHLGGFHTLMSFAGSIGFLMDGSGIASAFQTVYGEDTVKHMLGGKAIAKALRAHILLDSALAIKLQQMLFSDDEENKEYDTMTTEEMEEIEMVLSSDTDPIEMANAEVIKKLDICMGKLKNHLSSKSRTSKLWIQYMEYVNIMKQFVRAARSGDWSLNLISLQRMLNLFAATSHINYAKSARLYLQLMLDLPNKHPWLYQKLAVEAHHVVRRTDKFWAGLWPDLVIEQVLMRSLKSRGGLTRGRGMSSSVRALWVHSMHSCGSIHNAMTVITEHYHNTSEQHQELGKSRCQRDFDDLQKILEWLDFLNPFDGSRIALQSLSLGLVADASINCDNAEEVGKVIHTKLDNESVSRCSIKRSDQVKSLGILKNVVKIKNQTVNIDPTRLFSRLIVLLERCSDLKAYFQYELTPIPTSLFIDNMMRKPNKASLLHSLFGKDYQLITPSDIITTDVSVVDGGALLRKIPWKQGIKFKDIIHSYKNYVKSNYGQSTIVFDGYGNNPSTKDHEHSRRSCNISPKVKIENEIKLTMNQAAFLSNDFNKMEIINLMTPELIADGHIVEQSKDDADTMIVAAALEKALVRKTVTVFANDTDLIIMLLHHWNEEMENILVRSEYTIKGGKQLKQLSIREATSFLSVTVLQNLLFIHAFGGCDTTSAIHDKGKGAILRLIQKSKIAQKLSAVFNKPLASQTEIGKAGINIFILLYGGTNDDSLQSLRHTMYMKMAASSSKIKPSKLPPTERLAWFRSLRVYLQVCQWKTLMTCDMDPCEWGWKLENGKMVPIMTDQEVAPEELLLVIRCKCKLTSRNPCGSNQCSCRQNGLPCVSACGDCRGNGCNNQFQEEIDAEEEEFDDDIPGFNESDNLFERLFDI